MNARVLMIGSPKWMGYAAYMGNKQCIGEWCHCQCKNCCNTMPTSVVQAGR
jgi:hypothetical protein